VSTWSVLADPHRRAMLELLAERPRVVGELVDQLGLSQPSASKHLRVLRDAGLVRVSVEAQRRRYRLNPAPLSEIDAWLEPYRAFWSGRLDALERHLDTTRSEEQTR
jgi:DNA-binding transcriptional ArsR family regulator